MTMFFILFKIQMYFFSNANYFMGIYLVFIYCVHFICYLE